MPTYPKMTSQDVRETPSAGFWLSAWFGVLVLIGCLNALHRYFNDVADRVPVSLVPKLIEEMTGSFSFGVLLPLLIALLRRLRQIPGRWARYGCHALVLMALSLLHTSLMWGSRIVLFHLFGYGDYDYGVMSWRYVMEFPSDVFYYLLVALVLWLVDRYRVARKRELRAAQLETALSEARLDALRLQLNPHFLFNALNAVSSIMYEQPRVADEMLARIGELLRITLSTTEQEHSLQEEWRLLRLYLSIQQARFGDRLAIDIQADPSLDQARVPFLILQPVVENAIEHTGDAMPRQVELNASREGDTLQFCIRNRGSKQEARPHQGHGIGLSNTESRLQHLYGAAAGLRLQCMEEGGAQVLLWLPLAGVSS